MRGGAKSKLSDRKPSPAVCVYPSDYPSAIDDERVTQTLDKSGRAIETSDFSRSQEATPHIYSFCESGSNVKCPLSCNTLPDIVVTKIFQNLTCSDRISAALCCRHWNRIVQKPEVWSSCEFGFHDDKDAHHLAICRRYGHLIKHLEIVIDQTTKANRVNSRRFLELLASISGKQLVALVFRCVGQNPLFYKSVKYVDCLQRLLSNEQDAIMMAKEQGSCSRYKQSLKLIDLEGLLVAIPDKLVNTIAKYHAGVQTLNLLDSSLVCLLSSNALVSLIAACRQIRNLSIFKTCLSKRALFMFMCKTCERQRLSNLTLFFRHDEKFSEDIDESLWLAVIQTNPKLRMTLIFDVSCQQNRIALHLLPVLPVTKISIHTTIRSIQEINIIADYYADTIEELELKYDVDWALTPSPVLDERIRHFVCRSKVLKTLRIHCGLSDQTLKAIHDKYPHMSSNEHSLLYKEQEE